MQKSYNFSFDSDSKFKGLITICFYAKDLFQKLQCTYEVNAMIDNYFEYIIKNEKLLNFYLNYFKDEKSIKTLLNIDYVNKVFLFKIWTKRIYCYFCSFIYFLCYLDYF